MEGLLVPTNFTRASDTAVETALKFASIAGSTVTFIHFISYPDSAESIRNNQKRFEQHIHKEVEFKNDKLNQYLEKAKEYSLTGIRVIQLDTRYHHLFDYADNNEIFMIVMGTRGMKGTKELFIGSNAQRVVRQSKVPVLVVKEGYGYFKNKTLAFFSKFVDDDDSGFEKIMVVAKKYKLIVDLVSILLDSDEQKYSSIKKKMEMLEKKYKKLIRAKNIVTNNNFENAINNYVKKNNIDVVGLITHPRNGYKKVTDLSITEYMVNHLRYPVLAVHN